MNDKDKMNDIVALYAVSMPSDDDQTRSFMPHRIPHMEHPVSRDWEDLDCKAVMCVLNKFEKCIAPSRAKLDDTGRCTGFMTEQMLDVKTKKMLNE